MGLFSQDVPPVLENGDYVLFVVKEDNIFFIAVSKNELSPMLAIEFIKNNRPHEPVRRRTKGGSAAAEAGANALEQVKQRES